MAEEDARRCDEDMFLWNMVGAIWLLPALARFLIKPEKLRQKA